MSSSTVTYTSVYSDSESWRFQWVSDEDPEAPEEAPQSPGHAPPSPDYVPGHEHLPLPDYVPGPEYLEYLVLSDNEEERGGQQALAESTTLPAIDPILSAKDTEAFETNESAPTPPLHRLRRAGISVRLLPPMTASIEPCIAKGDIPEADLPPRKRLCLTVPTPRFEIEESSTAAAATARQAEHPMSREVGYGVTDTWDELVDAIQEIAPTTLKGVN
ncbi:hypothetical protein Tco_0987846 [Tanacetum coccineum]